MNPQAYGKLALIVSVGLLSIRPTLMSARWQRELAASGDLPDAAEVQKARRLIMVRANILPFTPLPAVFLARVYG